MVNKILFYVDAKLGRKWIKFIPVYGDGWEFDMEKQIMHSFRDKIREDFKDGFLDDNCVFYFDTRTSEALQFIWKNLDSKIYTLDYPAYQRVIDRKKAKEKDNNLSQKEFSPNNEM